MFGGRVRLREAVREAIGDILGVTKAAGLLRAQGSETDYDGLFDIATKLIYHAASRIAGEIRFEMGLDELGREWHLYDEEIRQLRDEVPELSEDGGENGEGVEG